VDQDWDDDPTGAWVEANAWRFGFIQSYPKGEEALTCYAFEPWHYRYLGRTLAARVRASGMTLRGFLWKRHVEGP
jgi:D-alanyl-D-alanine carboxypeptidase